MVARRSISAILCMFGALAAIADCSGGGAPLAPATKAIPSAPGATFAMPATVTGTATDRVDTPGPVSGTIALPAGSKIAPASLVVITSVGAAAVKSDGTFTVQGFPNGHALAEVMLPNGAPMLYGFIAPNAATIDATSTAAVFGFFACDAFVLTPDVREQALAQIMSAPAFGMLSSAVATALAASSDPLGLANAPLTAAVNAFAASIEAAGSASGSGLSKRTHDALTISPIGNSTGSGVNLIAEFPDGLHFANTYRRRAVAEVDRVSYVPAGSSAPVPAPTRLTATPLPIPPVNGLNSGLLPAIGDIFNTAFNQANNPSAYAPVNSSSIALPLVDGASKTTYQVTLLGPGASFGQFFALSNTDAGFQFNTALYYYVIDLAVPFITTVLLPLESDAIDASLAHDGAAELLNELLSDGGTLVPQLQADFQPDAKGHIDPLPGMNDAMRNLLENPLYQTTLETYFVNVVALKFGNNIAIQAGESLQTFDEYLEGFDFGLAAFDATVVGRDLRNSSEADQYTVTVVPDKLTLTPPTQTLTGITTGTLTATDLSNTGSDAVPLQYTWTNTAAFGHITDGLAGHIDSFTSTQSTVTYTPTGSGAGTDTVTVAIATLKGPNSPSQPIGAPLTATVAVQNVAVPVGKVSLMPACVYFSGVNPGTQQFTATVNLPQGDTITAYQWSLLESPNDDADLVVPGSSIVSSSGSMITYASASNTATLNVSPGSNYELQVGVQVIYSPASRSLPNPSAVTNIFGGPNNNGCPPGAPNPS